MHILWSWCNSETSRLTSHSWASTTLQKVCCFLPSNHKTTQHVKLKRTRPWTHACSYAPSPPTIAMVNTSSCTGGLGGSRLEYTHRITSLSSSPVMCELKDNASDKKLGGWFGDTASLIAFSCAQEKKKMSLGMKRGYTQHVTHIVWLRGLGEPTPTSR